MAKGEKRLERMRANPRDDWRIEDVESVCRAFGIDIRKPGSGSSHVTVSHPSQRAILTIPARKPIKPFYIVELVSFIDSVVEANS